MVQKSSKIVTKRIPVTLTIKQIEQINNSIGSLGSNQSDVLRYIVTNWLDEYKKGKNIDGNRST